MNLKLIPTSQIHNSVLKRRENKMIKEAIKKVVEGKGLTQDEAHQTMGEIMEGKTTDAQIAALITSLRMKKETIDEITGFAKAMRAHAVRIKLEVADVVDTCGTGGDLLGTFNISTAAAFVVAGCGVHIAKHGNRSVSSAAGSADVLEALGVKIDVSPEAVSTCIDKIGIGFLFAPLLHPAMRYAIGPRKEIGIRTVFNILGPLTNPAFASSQILGVYDLPLTAILAEVLGNLGVRHALVVHGADGMDEISTTGETTISEFKEGKVKTYTINPEEFGLPRAQIEDFEGGSPKDNAETLRSILKGEKGPKRDIVSANASAALVAADKVTDFKQGLSLAEESVDEGKALEKLDKLIEFSNRY